MFFNRKTYARAQIEEAALSIGASTEIVPKDKPGPHEAKFGAGIIRGRVKIVADGPEMQKLLQAAGILE